MPAPDVIVVGAGFAGLSAAVDLAARGARVLVLEARPGLGGRATAFQDPQTGETVDNGQHALFGCYHETFSFLRTIGTDHLVQLDEQLEIEVDRSAGPALAPALDASAASLASARRPAALGCAVVARPCGCRVARSGAGARSAAAPRRPAAR